MSEISVGTCSLCGGPVTVPAVWGGVIPPTPTCKQCGAVPADSHGPVREMKRPIKTNSTSSFIGWTRPLEWLVVPD